MAVVFDWKKRLFFSRLISWFINIPFALVTCWKKAAFLQKLASSEKEKSLFKSLYPRAYQMFVNNLCSFENLKKSTEPCIIFTRTRYFHQAFYTYGSFLQNFCAKKLWDGAIRSTAACLVGY